METIFLVLSGVILAAGVLYWFWSHIQLTQKKVQLLENAVFELRGIVSGNPEAAVGGGGPSHTDKVPTPVYQDLADDEEEDWAAGPAGVPSSIPSFPSGVPVQRPSSVEIGSTPLSSLQEDASADLQPGGRLEVPTPSMDEQPTPKVVNTDDQFRELFVQREPRTPASPQAAASGVTDDSSSSAAAPAPAASVTSESLESMPVKDLRRLAEQRGLTGVSEMRKKEILSALRQQITSVPAAASTEKSTTVVVERTLDLTQMEAGGIEEATVLE